MGDSSEESWTMHESVIQLYRVDEEGYFACKVLSAINMFLHGAIMTALAEEAPANFCASSRGKADRTVVLESERGYGNFEWRS
jgi:hypothetical protein